MGLRGGLDLGCVSAGRSGLSFIRLGGRIRSWEGRGVSRGGGERFLAPTGRRRKGIPMPLTIAQGKAAQNGLLGLPRGVDIGTGPLLRFVPAGRLYAVL